MPLTAVIAESRKGPWKTPIIIIAMMAMIMSKRIVGDTSKGELL